jgi:hypothetical protein
MPPPEWVRHNAGFLTGLELSLGVALVASIPLMWVARPAYMGGPGADTTITDLVAIGMAVFGLFWLIGLATAAPEGDGNHWRSRSKRR